MTAHNIFIQSMHSFLEHTPNTTDMSEAIQNEIWSVPSEVLVESLGDINT